MANIASGQVEITSSDEKFNNDLVERIKDGPFHYGGDADITIKKGYIFCGFTGRWSCEDSWDFFRALLEDDDYEFKDALIEAEKKI